MDPVTAEITIKSNGRMTTAKATKMRFCGNLCLAYDNSPEDLNCLFLISNYLLSKSSQIALFGSGKLFHYLLNYAPQLRTKVACVLELEPAKHAQSVEGIPVLSPQNLPSNIKTVFLCETITVDRLRMKKHLPADVEAVSLDILPQLDLNAVPERAWIYDFESIYPIDIPEIEFLPNQDLILLDCPARNLALMPNGLAYVHNALKKTSISFQTVDLDIITYHRYHTYRLLDANGTIKTASGFTMAADPWLAEAYDEWQKPEVIDYFQPIVDEVVEKLTAAKPKILGLSIQACNIRFCREVVKGVKASLPDTIILVGGYSCYQSTIGRRNFPESDYMCIGEADLTVGSLVEALARGERPKDLPGVFSRFDSEFRIFKPGPQPQDLDVIEIPKYEWYKSLDLYRNYNDYQLTPIIASRGCRWSRCTFCAERFFWRVRSPKNVVDEFQWLNEQGCDLFMFNESDLNGKPEILMEICEEIARRGLKIKLTGQLRINKSSDRHFFDVLRKGGFVALRFGVDAWSTNTLRQQMKGYTTDMVYQNLKDCWEAGIYTEVNTVIGVPGETDEDIDEGIELMVKCKPYIGRAANINPLMLVIGSVYWEDPDKFKIKFRGNKQELFEKFPSLIPVEYWYSEEPYIDQSVRLKRFEKMVRALYKHGFDVGAFAKQVIKDIEEGKGADHSARPDIANALEKDSEITNSGAGANNGAHIVTCEDASPSPIKAQSLVDTETNTAVEKKYRIIQYGSEFYGLPVAEHEELADVSSAVVVKKKGRFETLIPELAKRSLAVLRDKERLADYKRRIVRILNSEGLPGVTKRVVNRLRNMRTDALVVESGHKIDVKRDFSAEVQLFTEGFHGYNIVNVRREYYGIKQGYPFDKQKADNHQYEKGICFKGKNVKDVERLILEFISEFAEQKLLKEGFHQYNILQVGTSIYAIKQGQSFDKKKADQARYEKGLCFKAASVQEAEALVKQYVEASEKLEAVSA